MYSTDIPEISDKPVEFGTSGLLYRSNKLMYDRVTNTLWRQFTGEPVVGRLANSGIELETFPVALTTWGEWLAANPDTTVLSADTGWYPAETYYPEPDPRAIYYFYFSTPGTMFPVWRQSDALPAKTPVLGVLVGGIPRAYPLVDLVAEPVVNDSIGEIDIVVVTEPDQGGPRGYAREDVTFTAELGGELGANTIFDTEGGTWLVTEEALKLKSDPSVRLARLPTHMAFWFGWYANYPNSLIYGREPG